MAVTRWTKHKSANSLVKTCNVRLFNSTGGTIATVSKTFTTPEFDTQGDNTWFGTNIAFEDIAAGTIVGSFSVYEGTSESLIYIENQSISGTEASRTIGPAGGRVVLDIELAWG
jgi:hypothetical protein